MANPILSIGQRLGHLFGISRNGLRFSDEESQAIVDAIAEAERTTSAEIRVHISHKYKGDDIVKAAETVFQQLGMHQTQERNGILIFMVPKQRQFAIFGDAGINVKMQPSDWDEIRDRMQQQFQAKQFADGVIQGISDIGKILSTHFPPTTENPNELSNQLSTDA